MNALARVVVGLLLVVVDVRLGGFDVVPDPLGWLVAGIVLVRLRPRHPGFLLAAAGCSVGLVASAWTVLEEEPTWVTALTTLVLTLLVFAVCTALVALAQDPAVRTGADRVRWVDLGLTVLLVALLPLVGTDAGTSDGLLVLSVVLAVATLATFVCFCVVLAKAGRQPPFAREAVSVRPA